jgi:uncharacterized protein (TIGR02246 family)
MKWTVTVMMLLTASPNWAEQPKQDTADENALRELHREFVAAYNNGDARAVAAFYAPDADFVGFGGDAYHGRAEIEKRTANFFAQSKRAKLTSPFGSLRFITPDVAIADRTEELTPAVEGGGCLRQTRWKMAAGECTLDDSVPRVQSLMQNDARLHFTPLPGR